MTNILAVETSSNNCSVALLKGGQIFELTEDAPREHTRKLLPMIDTVLTENGVTLSELDAIACGCGPGSFTGLRICLGVVQGLAYGQDLPLIPVSSLQTIARTAARQSQSQGFNKGQLLVANDARMDEVYACLYRFEVQSDDVLDVEALSEELVIAPERLWSESRLPQLQEDFIAVGDGWHYPKMAEAITNETIGNREAVVIRATAGAMLDIAAEKLKRGETVAAEASEPTYLRDSVAWKKRERIRNH